MLSRKSLFIYIYLFHTNFTPSNPKLFSSMLLMLLYMLHLILQHLAPVTRWVSCMIPPPYYVFYLASVFKWICENVELITDLFILTVCFPSVMHVERSDYLISLVDFYEIW